MAHELIEGRFVVCAACKYGDLILAGPRHFDKVMQSQIARMNEDGLFSLEEAGTAVQGFLDQYGVFMDRKEAMQVALAAGQVNVRRKKIGPLDILFSEDLY